MTTEEEGRRNEYIVYSEKQLDTLLEWQEDEQTNEQSNGHVRKKRKLNSADLVELWELPIPYKFSGHHSKSLDCIQI